MATNGNTIAYRVEQLERSYEKLDAKIEKIMENHLPHLEAKVDSLNTRIMVLTGVNLTAIILAIIASRLV